MKAHLSKLTLIVMLIIIALPCHSQQTTTVSFNYDANGNRIIRQIEIGGTKGDDNIRDCLAPAFVDDFETLSVTLYPNPTSGQITIELEGMQKVMVYNTLGHVLLNKEVSSDVLQLDLSGFENGLYWVKVMAQNGTAVRSFVISR